MNIPANLKQTLSLKRVFSKGSVSVRGFMLDISRGRVPKREELFALVDLLARLNYNQLQLYIEHTFAFKDHEDVWRDASPLSGKEIRELDVYCREREIELVPNLNSFGHVERWLKHERYKTLAECPNGFFHELFKMQRAAGTFAAGTESADFMGKLYREFLPNFSSEKFNIGGDEPWELGQGRSRKLCEKNGKREVYLEQMMRLKKQAAACGKKMMFWGDVLLGESGSIPVEFLRETIPVIWGYDSGHPFGQQCDRVNSALRRMKHRDGFYIAPGTSAWLSFGTRASTAFINIREACLAAKKYGAQGVLLTTWGDFGYHNPFSANLLPLIFCAAEMNDEAIPKTAEDFFRILKELDFPHADVLAEGLFSFGQLDDFFEKKVVNRSLIRELFFTKKETLPQLVEGIRLEEIALARTECERILSLLETVPAHSREKNRGVYVPFCEHCLPELYVAVKMANAALLRADAFLKNNAFARIAIEAEMAGSLKNQFAETWRLRNRDGGLAESLSYFF